MAQVALVTGANRSPGIGNEIARGLAQKLPAGSTVILTSRDRAMGLEAEAGLKEEGLNVVFQQLDVCDAASVEALQAFVSTTFGGLDVIVNNAGLAFPMADPTPFPEQARRTVEVNYYGTKRVIESLRPPLRPGFCLVGISSTAGQLGSSWSPALKQRLLAEDLTVAGLDAIAEEFVAAAATGRHKDLGFPGTAYGTSKTLMTQLHRVLARDMPSPCLVTAVCPGLCRTYMATGRGTFMSNVLWLASFVVGNSAAGGADTPLWLCCELPEEDRAEYHGKFVVADRSQLGSGGRFAGGAAASLGGNGGCCFAGAGGPALPHPPSIPPEPLLLPNPSSAADRAMQGSISMQMGASGREPLGSGLQTSASAAAFGAAPGPPLSRTAPK
ncbi:unnamed protein product, partial [Polarella glacialis]